MKKILLIFCICLMVSTFLLLRSAFKIFFKQEEAVIVDESKTEETIEEKEQETTIENTPEPEPVNDKEEDSQQVYRMLDFDRRYVLSIGEQDDYTCSIYCLAYARAILDNNFNVNPYDYWDDGAVWREADFTDIASTDPLDVVLKRAYNEIDKGRPVIFYVSGAYAYGAVGMSQERTAEQHFVLLIGFKADADYNNLKPSDFYAADPSAGYKYSADDYTPWVVLSDSSPEKMLGEYALFTDIDETRHVNTCLAHADKARWDADLSKAIGPDYAR